MEKNEAGSARIRSQRAWYVHEYGGRASEQSKGHPAESRPSKSGLLNQDRPNAPQGLASATTSNASCLLAVPNGGGPTGPERLQAVLDGSHGGRRHGASEVPQIPGGGHRDATVRRRLGAELNWRSPRATTGGGVGGRPRKKPNRARDCAESSRDLTNKCLRCVALAILPASNCPPKFAMWTGMPGLAMEAIS